MSPDLFLALQVSVIGMALVFGAIVLFWGLMALLVRVTPDDAGNAVAEAAAWPDPGADDRELRQRAAAVAVAAALAEQRQATPARQAPPPPTAAVSAWQAVMRADQLDRRGPVR
jgi:Na+-transporting methylmalonyl-CoA/oxaloacetate decarboxylase gamma subunit